MQRGRETERLENGHAAGNIVRLGNPDRKGFCTSAPTGGIIPQKEVSVLKHNKIILFDGY